MINSSTANIKSIFKEAWLKRKGYFLTFWGSSLIVAIITMIPMALYFLKEIILKSDYPSYAVFLDKDIEIILTICISILLAGPLLTALKVQAIHNVENKLPQIKELFIYLKNPFRFLLAGPVFIIAFLFPPLGFLIYIFMQFFDVLIVEKNLKTFKAFVLSFKGVKKNFLLVLGTNFAGFLLFLLILLPFLIHIRFWTLLLTLALLFLYFPLVANVYGILYKQLFMESEKSNETFTDPILNNDE